MNPAPPTGAVVAAGSIEPFGYVTFKMFVEPPYCTAMFWVPQTRYGGRLRSQPDNEVRGNDRVQASGARWLHGIICASARGVRAALINAAAINMVFITSLPRMLKRKPQWWRAMPGKATAI